MHAAAQSGCDSFEGNLIFIKLFCVLTNVFDCGCGYMNEHDRLLMEIMAFFVSDFEFEYTVKTINFNISNRTAAKKTFKFSLLPMRRCELT